MQLRGVRRRYGLRGRWVLDGVECELRAGSLTRLEGPNGSGKSTLLRVVAGIELPDEGAVVDRPAVTGYAPERFPATLPLTAGEYLHHLARVHGLRGDLATDAGEEWLERLGADAYLDTPIDQLSKGAGQKVAVAQALLARPRLLVLDEAWTGLDTRSRAVLDAAVRQLRAEGTAVVFADHDPRRLAGEGAAVYRLVEGRLLQEDAEQGASGGALGALARSGAGAVAVGGGADAGASPGAVAVAAEADGDAEGARDAEQADASSAVRPRVRIVAQAASGVTPPRGTEGRQQAGGYWHFEAAEEASDAVLRRLLEAPEAWHVVSLGTVRTANGADGPGLGEAAARAAAEATGAPGDPVADLGKWARQRAGEPDGAGSVWPAGAEVANGTGDGGSGRATPVEAQAAEDGAGAASRAVSDVTVAEYPVSLPDRAGRELAQLPHPLRRLAAAMGYQAALVLHSRRWLPPAVLYAALLAVGLQGGRPVLDAVGYAAAVVVPVAAWLVRSCVGLEPTGARQCGAAAVGPVRLQLATIVAGFVFATALGVLGVGVALGLSAPRSSGPHTVPVSQLAALGAGLLAVLVCTLLGAGVGALCGRPVLRGTGRALPALLLGVLLVLVVPFSPANVAMRQLVDASGTGQVAAPWGAFAAAVVVAGAAFAGAARVARRR